MALAASRGHILEHSGDVAIADGFIRELKGAALAHLARRAKNSAERRPCERAVSTCWPHGPAGSAAGMPKVPSTTSTKFLSSRRMNRFACAIAKFSRPSESAFRRVRYASYEVRLSNAINPHATSFVPSCGRKYPTRCPPHRGMMRPQFSAYFLNASRWNGSIW